MSKDDTKETFIKVRMTKKQKNKAQIRADLYADGNLSLWVRYCIDNPKPKILKKKSRELWRSRDHG